MASPVGSAAQSSAAAPHQWLDGVISGVGDAPTVTDPQGRVHRFAYRALKRFGGPKVRLSVGDRVQFVRSYKRGKSAGNVIKVTQMRPCFPEECLPFGDESERSSIVDQATSACTSELAASVGCSPPPSSLPESSSSTPLASSLPAAREPSADGSCWAHDPYSWGLRDGYTYCGERRLEVEGQTIKYDRFFSV
eukprot:TRINITY_DN464_c0_g2_i1.p1 TRINITY_DN464_c0_g2~~TRINITY_DN464_c0_g2_i1.p1  ORF type:complete len:193 (+),score=28.68 TRINITY_DN464_c0_g2_i1:78-656(+)